MLSRVSCNKCLAGETVPSLFVPEPKTFGYTQACRSGKGWRFFRYTDAEKYYSLADCLDGLCSASYNQSGDGRENCLLLFRSHPARRRGYDSAGRTCSVQVGRDGEIKLHSHEYCRSSFPKQSRQVLWLQPLLQHSFSFRVWSTCSICCEVGHLPCLHKR